MSVRQLLLANINGVRPNDVRGAGLAPAATSACTTANGPYIEAQCRAVHPPLSAVFTLCWPRCWTSHSAMVGFLW